jgi:hypothetical protein
MEMMIDMILAVFQLIPFLVTMLISATISVAAGYLAAALAKKPKNKVPEFGNYPSQTSLKAIPIPKIYGTRRVAGNIVYYKQTSSWHDDRGFYWYFHDVLLVLCEGPATVTKMWFENSKLSAGGPNYYFFDGDGTTAWRLRDDQREETGQSILDLTGQSFGDYQNLCCVFMHDITAGEFRKDVPNFTFEVKSYVPMDFFVGAHYTTGVAGGRPIVWRMKFDGSLDTSWGENGYWRFRDDVSSGQTLTCYKTHVLSDGRVLVAHNPFWIEGPDLAGGGKYVGCTMLTAQGAIDTSWGYNGHYVLRETGNDYSMTSILQLLIDNSGNFYVCGEGAYEFQKFDSNGTRLYATTPLDDLYDMCWADDGKTRIIAVGGFTNPAGPGYANCIAINPDDGTIDIDWVGNEGNPGYAFVEAGATTSGDADAIVRTDDGFYVLHGLGNSGNYYSLTKLKFDGSGYVTSFGTSGHVAAGWPNYKKQSLKMDGFNVWTLTENNASGAPVGTDNSLRCWDKNGDVVFSQDWDSNTTDPIHSMNIIGGYLWFGTKGSGWTTINHYIEKWNRNAEYVTGFDPAGLTPTSIFTINGYRDETEIVDENPALIIRDMITNTRYGARLSASVIDDTNFIAVEDYCQDNDILISIVLKDGKPVVDWIDFILAHCNGYRWWSGGKLKLGVFKDEDAVGETITQDDLVVEGDEPPVVITPRKRSETYNLIRVGWTNRDNMYDYSSETAEDKVDQQWRSEVRTREVELDGYCRIILARKMAWRMLFESMYRYNMYSFKVGYKHSLIEVGDVKLLSDGNRIVEQKIRILSVREEKDGRTLSIEAIEEAAGLYATTAYDSQDAWTPRVLDGGDDCTVTDAFSGYVSPLLIFISPNELDNVNMTDEATAEIV